MSTIWTKCLMVEDFLAFPQTCTSPNWSFPQLALALGWSPPTACTPVFHTLNFKVRKPDLFQLLFLQITAYRFSTDMIDKFSEFCNKWCVNSNKNYFFRAYEPRVCQLDCRNLLNCRNISFYCRKSNNLGTFEQHSRILYLEKS